MARAEAAAGGTEAVTGGGDRRARGGGDALGRPRGGGGDTGREGPRAGLGGPRRRRAADEPGGDTWRRRGEPDVSGCGRTCPAAAEGENLGFHPEFGGGVFI